MPPGRLAPSRRRAKTRGLYRRRDRRAVRLYSSHSRAEAGSDPPDLVGVRTVMSRVDTGRSRPPENRAERVDLVCDRFEADWRAGRHPRIEDLLDTAPAGDRSVLLRELLAL